jgi:hypothetical protein
MKSPRLVPALCLLASLFPAGQVRGDGLPKEVRQTNSAPAAIGPIQEFVRTHVAGLTSANPAEQAAARDALLDEAAPSANANALFLDLYSSELVKQLAPVLKSSDHRAKLNAGIVTTRVAEAQNRVDQASPRLIDVCVQLLADENDAVVIWGLKASRAVMPVALKTKDTRLAQAIVDAAVRNPHGAVAEDAYEALKIDTGTAPQPTFKPNIATVVPLIHKILQSRLEAYKTGIPSDPSSDARAAAFLGDSKVFSVQNAADQLYTVQLLANLISFASQRYETATPAERLSLHAAITRTAAALNVISQAVKNEPLNEVTLDLARKTPVTASPQLMNQMVSPVLPALLKVPAFAKLTVPPQLPSLGGQNGPSTGPAI